MPFRGNKIFTYVHGQLMEFIHILVDQLDPQLNASLVFVEEGIFFDPPTRRGFD